MNTITSQNEYINLNQAVSLLGVSSATVRNWIKHNYLKPQEKDGKQLVFKSDEVKELKKKIASGEVNRLNKRANKKSSQSTFVPDEYIDNSDVLSSVEKLVAQFKEKELQRDKVLYSIALNLLQRKQLVNSNFIARNKAVQNELDWWQKRTETHYAELLDVTIPEVSDILGVIYQSLTAEGNKAESGSYYTPKKVVNEIVDTYVERNHLVLDPCCGTGQFLLSIAEKVKDPSKVWGFDIDEVAVRLARLNLLLHFANKDFEPHIYHKNSLTFNSKSLFTENNVPAFDVVITNPPWGVHFSKEQSAELQSIFPEVRSGEAFSYFVKQGLNLLKENGVLSFILPEAILNIKTHRDIREVLVKKTNIKKVKYLNRVFKNVFTPVIRLDVIKAEPVLKNIIKAEKDGSEYELEQSRLQDNADYVLNVFTDNNDVSLFDKVYSIEHTTLKDKADWALGVVTGDNKKHLVSVRTKTTEPILTGKDIKKFTTVPASNYIDFKPDNFQQVAPEHKYRAKEKLFYKFISKELVFAYDDKQTLSLNSANILIPKIENYPIKTILALLNSSLYQFLYQKKFGAIKILRSDIEKLPMPILEENRHKEIEKLVHKLLDSTQETTSRKKTFDELDDLIMDIFKLSENEKKYVMKSIKVSDKLLNNH